MNEILWMGFAVLDLGMVILLYRLFGAIGLYALISFNLILCNIQVLKIIELFGLTTTLGNILYASIFLSTDILSECHGKKAAQKAVILGFATLLMATVYMQVALLFKPAVDDFVQPHLAVIFGFMPRVAAASMLAYLVSQLHDVWAFHFWKNKTRGKYLWLRNNLSTAASQFIDSSVFCIGAFLGVFPAEVWLQILFTTFAVKLIIAAIDTPFIYFARRISPAAQQT